MYAAFETAVAEDGSLSQYTNVKITDVFDSWIQNPGAPVVHVNVDHSTGVITVKQVRILFLCLIPFLSELLNFCV